MDAVDRLLKAPYAQIVVAGFYARLVNNYRCHFGHETNLILKLSAYKRFDQKEIEEFRKRKVGARGRFKNRIILESLKIF